METLGITSQGLCVIIYLVMVAGSRKIFANRENQILLFALFHHGWNKSEISRYFNCDHTSVLHQIKKFSGCWVDEKGKMKRGIDHIQKTDHFDGPLSDKDRKFQHIVYTKKPAGFIHKKSVTEILPTTRKLIMTTHIVEANGEVTNTGKSYAEYVRESQARAARSRLSKFNLSVQKYSQCLA